MSLSDLEVAWLHKVSGSSALNSLADLRKLVMPDGPYVYWSATSGLTPASLYSTTDHKIAAMKIAVPGASGTATDVSRQFYAANLP